MFLIKPSSYIFVVAPLQRQISTTHMYPHCPVVAWERELEKKVKLKDWEKDSSIGQKRKEKKKKKKVMKKEYEKQMMHKAIAHQLPNNAQPELKQQKSDLSHQIAAQS